MRDLEPPTPLVRYEYAEPAGLIHIDIKKLGRFERIGHRITGKRTEESAVAFLTAAVAYYASLGVTVRRVMTDNGSCYRSRAFAKTSPGSA